MRICSGVNEILNIQVDVVILSLTLCKVCVRMQSVRSLSGGIAQSIQDLCRRRLWPFLDVGDGDNSEKGIPTVQRVPRTSVSTSAKVGSVLMCQGDRHGVKGGVPGAGCGRLG